MSGHTCSIQDTLYTASTPSMGCLGCAGEHSQDVCDELAPCSGVIWVVKGRQPAEYPSSSPSALYKPMHGGFPDA